MSAIEYDLLPKLMARAVQVALGHQTIIVAPVFKHGCFHPDLDYYLKDMDWRPKYAVVNRHALTRDTEFNFKIDPNDNLHPNAVVGCTVDGLLIWYVYITYIPECDIGITFDG